MRTCIECKFVTDYGDFLFCEMKKEIIRHEKREALFCRYYPLTYRDLDTLGEFLGNYPKGGDEDGLGTGVALFNRYGYQRLCSPDSN